MSQVIFNKNIKKVLTLDLDGSNIRLEIVAEQFDKNN
jgi:hypothetical protein